MFWEDAVSLGVQREGTVRVKMMERDCLGVSSMIHKVAEVDADLFERL